MCWPAIGRAGPPASSRNTALDVAVIPNALRVLTGEAPTTLLLPPHHQAEEELPVR